MKKDKYIYVCENCGSEFSTEKKAKKHELTCEKKSKIKKTNINTIFGLASLLVIYLFFYFVINTNAENNGLETKDLLQPQKWFSSEVDEVITPTPITTTEITPTSTPTTKPKTQVTTNTGSQIDCIGPDGKQFKTSMTECKALNDKWGKPVDYMINCTYSDLCVGGGGVKYVKKSECDKPCPRASTQITNQNTNTTNYPPCEVYSPTLKTTQTLYNQSPSDCQKLKDVINPTNNSNPTPYIAPTIYVQPIPTVDQSAINTRISQCKSNCVSSVDSYITSVVASCRASGGWSSYCSDVQNSRSAQISSCQSNCY